MIFNAKALEANEALKMSRELLKQQNDEVQEEVLDKFRQTVEMDNTEIVWVEESIPIKKSKIQFKVDDFKKYKQLLTETEILKE